LSELSYEGDSQNPIGCKAPPWARLAMQADSAREAMAAIREEAPHVFLLHHAKLEKTLALMFPTTTVAQYRTFKPSFQNLPLEKPLVLAGKSGTGKTQCALAQFRRPLLVKNVEDLRSLCADHDGIVFDDMSFLSYTAEVTIALLSVEYERSIPARYTDIVLPAHVPLIFTTNIYARLFPRGLGHWNSLERDCRKTGRFS